MQICRSVEIQAADVFFFRTQWPPWSQEDDPNPGRAGQEQNQKTGSRQDMWLSCGALAAYVRPWAGFSTLTPT